MERQGRSLKKGKEPTMCKCCVKVVEALFCSVCITVCVNLKGGSWYV